MTHTSTFGFCLKYIFSRKYTLFLENIHSLSSFVPNSGRLLVLPINVSYIDK